MLFTKEKESIEKIDAKSLAGGRAIPVKGLWVNDGNYGKYVSVYITDQDEKEYKVFFSKASVKNAEKAIEEGKSLGWKCKTFLAVEKKEFYSKAEKSTIPYYVAEFTVVNQEQ